MTTINLTDNEKAILNAMRQNEYGDALQDGCTWTFTAIDNSGMTGRSARGVISSLVKKGLVEVTPYDSQDDPSSINFTNEGKKLFEDADGKECSWGGPKLLKI